LEHTTIWVAEFSTFALMQLPSLPAVARQ
jgi:hypothetical protein